MTVSEQEFYDRTIQHLIDQGCQAIESAGDFRTCTYLAPDGTKCAAGYWIPDGHPAQKVDDTIDYVLQEYPDLAELFPSLPLALELQRLHDRELGEMGINRYFTKRARRIANDHGLTPFDFSDVEVAA